jgi:hypothetical protein
MAVAMGVVPPAASPASASSPQGDRCANVDLAYFPNRVHPGGLFEMVLSVENCSPRAERILVGVRANGPCQFGHPHDSVYPLEAGIGFQVFALMVAPECLGAYRVAVAAVVKDVVLDTSRAGFNVLPPE